MFSKKNDNSKSDNLYNDTGDKSECILEEAKRILLSKGAQIINEEEIKMRICYKIKDSLSKNIN